MNDDAPELIEAELHRLNPVRPPEAFMARLAAARPAPRAQREGRSQPWAQFDSWRWLLRWLAPVTAAVAVVAALLVWRWPGADRTPAALPKEVAAKSALRANAVEFDRELVASFDAVARLPSGEPVRFRCREWTDGVVLRDAARGVVIERRTPRLEVVPVSFETY
jgi:hypothetical protein